MAPFLGLFNYYPRLIPHFTEDAVPLNKHTSEHHVLQMPELSDAFAELKSDLAHSVALRLPNPEKLLLLETDPSSGAVGAVVIQMDGIEQLITLFYSLALNSPQRKYSTYERELLAAMKGCDACRVFLLARHFRLRTDHKALGAIFKSGMSVWSRVSKCLIELQPFYFAIEVNPGKENVMGDCISRIPGPLQ